MLAHTCDYLMVPPARPRDPSLSDDVMLLFGDIFLYSEAQIDRLASPSLFVEFVLERYLVFVE